MDQFTLPAGYMNAGEQFLSALRKLGLDPDGLLWAEDKNISKFVMVLVTSQFDFAGPSEIYRLLTRAYNLSATPKEISPFIVRVHSPRQHIVQRLREAYGWKLEMRGPDGPLPAPAELTMEIGDLKFQRSWFYFLNPKKLKPVERSRRWNRFKANVESLAA